MFIARRKKNCGGVFSPEFKLGWAVVRGDLAEVKRLVIDCGVNPNIQSTAEGGTPLHVAADRGYLRIVKFLLKHGANPNMKNDYGNTPLHDAAAFGHREVVKLLLEHGANPNIRDNDGYTPLHYAVGFCYVDVVRVLLDHGADPTIRDKKGRTPLEIGRKCGKIIEELRRGGTRTTVYE
jgi:ankyrin repeat protein